MPTNHNSDRAGTLASKATCFFFAFHLQKLRHSSGLKITFTHCTQFGVRNLHDPSLLSYLPA